MVILTTYDGSTSESTRIWLGTQLPSVCRESPLDIMISALER